MADPSRAELAPEGLDKEVRRFESAVEQREASLAAAGKRAQQSGAAVAALRLAAERVRSTLPEDAAAKDRLEQLWAAIEKVADDQRRISTALKNERRSTGALLELQRQITVEVATLRRANIERSRPRGLGRLARNLVMVASPRGLAAKLKNIALWTRVRRDRARLQLWNELFDRVWYLDQHVDVFASGVDPTYHYITTGYLEKRAASPYFDAPRYLDLHRDVAASGVNPLLHYVLFGADEQRSGARRGWSTAGSPTARYGLSNLPLSVASRGGSAGTRGGPALRRVQPGPRSEPLISIVIPCFNYGRFIEDAIGSVQRQTFTNWELIVVEGGSTDGSTPDKVREMERRGLPKTRFLFREGRHYAGDNRNFGIAAARGEYVCCLDADDMLKPSYLEIAVFCAETYGYDVVYPSVQFFGDDDGTWILCDATFGELLDHNQVSTVALFRRSLWEDAGGYRDWGVGGAHVPEDWDFWVRLIGNGAAPKCIAEPMMLYRRLEGSLSKSSTSTIDYQRGEIAAANVELIASGQKARLRRPEGTWESVAERNTQPGVMLALPFITIGGAERVFESIARWQQGQGYQVVIVTTLVLREDIPDNRKHFETITPHVYSLPHLFEMDEQRWADFLSYALDRYNVESVFIAGCEFFYYLLPELRRVFPEIGVVDQLFNDQVHFPNNRRYAEYIDVTMVPSQAFADRVTGEFRESPERVAVIPHGVNVPPLGASEAGAKASLPESIRDKFIVGFFGRMSQEKGAIDFVEIARSLATDSAIAFVMTGDGPERPAVLKRIAQYGLGDRIYAPGFVEDASPVLAASDVVVVPSRLDGMPLIVLEAQAAGKPVVASEVGSIPAMVATGETGLLCRPGDTAGFAKAVRSLYESEDLREALGKAGRESVIREHSSAAMMKRYAAVFAAARERGAKRAGRPVPGAATTGRVPSDR